nr:MAG TPA: hypothetical protein [Caudoviricetes sp.]
MISNYLLNKIFLICICIARHYVFFKDNLCMNCRPVKHICNTTIIDSANNKGRSIFSKSQII